MSTSKRHKQAELKKQLEKGKLRERERLLQQLPDEFLGPFVSEYDKVKATACSQHPSLLGIYECNDDVFYDLSLEEKVEKVGLGHLSVVYMDTTDDIDLSIDPKTSAEGVVNERRQRPTGEIVTGSTSRLTDGKDTFSVIFMRRETGGSDSPEAVAALKLTALFHELGHVTDYEEGINVRDGKVDLVAAESFAHHFACRALIRGKYRLPLGHYMDGVEKMALSDSEYVKRSAKAVIESNEYQGYKKEISTLYKSE